MGQPLELLNALPRSSGALLDPLPNSYSVADSLLPARPRIQLHPDLSKIKDSFPKKKTKTKRNRSKTVEEHLQNYSWAS